MALSGVQSFVLASVAAMLLAQQTINTPVLAQAASSKIGNPITGEGLPNPAPIVTQKWGQLPAGRKWGTTAGITIDPTDGNVWVYERCGAGTAGGGPVDCDNNPVDPIFKFDRKTGAVLANFGKGLMVTPHGIGVDRQGNVWVTDFAGNKDGTKGHQVHKFSSKGEKLLSLGTAGKPSNADGQFNQPNAVAIRPDGSIYVADGHDAQGMITPDAVAEGLKRGATSRINKFFARRAVHQIMGTHRRAPWRIPHTTRAGVRFAGASVGGGSRKSPDRDLRPERNLSRIALLVRPCQRTVYQGQHGLCDRLGVGTVQRSEPARRGSDWPV